MPRICKVVWFQESSRRPVPALRFSGPKSSKSAPADFASRSMVLTPSGETKSKILCLLEGLPDPEGRQVTISFSNKVPK